MEKLSIGILAHEQDLNHKHWIIDVLKDCWELAGHTVNKFSPDHPNLPTCDVWFAHFDSSLIRDEVFSALPDGVKIINRHLLDIRRDAYSDLIIHKGKTDHQGKVIVKSRNNCGGRPERSLARNKIRQGPIWQKFFKLWRPSIVFKSYLVYDNILKVPSKYLKNKNIVIEKFISERIDGYNIIYYTYFLGKQSFTFRMCSYKEIIKWKDIEDYSIVDTPDEVMAWAKEHKMDFGKIDYVYSDGELFVFDLNKTPGRGSPSKKELTEDDEFNFYNSISLGLLDLIPSDEES